MIAESEYFRSVMAEITRKFGLPQFEDQHLTDTGRILARVCHIPTAESNYKGRRPKATDLTVVKPMKQNKPEE